LHQRSVINSKCAFNSHNRIGIADQSLTTCVCNSHNLICLTERSLFWVRVFIFGSKTRVSVVFWKWFCVVDVRCTYQTGKKSRGVRERSLERKESLLAVLRASRHIMSSRYDWIGLRAIRLVAYRWNTGVHPGLCSKYNLLCTVFFTL
jgi:hypothetical protein